MSAWALAAARARGQDAASSQPAAEPQGVSAGEPEHLDDALVTEADRRRLSAAERAGRARLKNPAAVFAPVESPVQRPADPRPAPRINVIIFVVDALRADRVGAYGYHERANTPAMDALAQEAVLFEQAYAAAPWTLPSVSSLFTSTFACEHANISRRTSLSPNIETLPERLHRCGYENYGLYANSFLDPQFGLVRAFDLQAWSARTDGQRVNAVLGPDPAQPFFLYIHNLEPHNPYYFSPPHSDGFRDVGSGARLKIKRTYDGWKEAVEFDFNQNRPAGATNLTAELAVRLASFNRMYADYSELYDAAVRSADERVGSVIQVLKQRNLWDSALFILTADHGEELGDHGGWLHDQSVYEELVRVPLLMKLPGGKFAGKRIETPARLIDVLPTVLDCLERRELLDGASGESLMPLIQDQADLTARAAEPLIVSTRINQTSYYRPWKESRGDINVAVRFGWWKAIWNAEIGATELYDLASDPGEKIDLHESHPEVAERLQEFARSWLERCDATAQPAPQSQPLSPDTQRRLRSIGYVN